MLDGRETLNSTSSGEDGVCGQKEQTGFIYYTTYIRDRSGCSPLLLGGPSTCRIQVLATGLAVDTKLSADSGGSDSPAMDNKNHALLYFQAYIGTNFPPVFHHCFIHSPPGHATDSQEEIINFIFLFYTPFIYFPTIHPFTPPFFIYSFFPCLSLSFCDIYI